MSRKTITAPEGMILTNGIDYGFKIDLGVWDSSDNYHPIPIEEYETILEAQKEKFPL